ncbi:hypothetical protein [Pseudomonas corrugata]|uniref:hypothetical protein n=1 Tax=Pseudomonas corrugata TaxID=47879 RepID=UPI0028C4FD14|nr:hypothetical protein [Pseudomonas corrugata]MDU9026242.1 hypothetical protein [Pseudomonas corrugata]
MHNAGSGTKKPHKEVPPAISAEALLGKSKLYASRALRAKASKDSEVYQIWAALALELLGKAQLARIHPCLVVETENTNSLLEACGIETDTKVKTISAHVVFARLKHTVGKFGTPHAEACKVISSRRNAELHSGQAAFTGMVDKDWEGQFWSTAQLILASMALELEDWVGSDSKIPATLAQDFRTIKVEAAKQRIANARATFLSPEGKKLGKKELEALRQHSKTFQWYSYHGTFRYPLDNHWDVPCPACECKGFIGGDRVHEEVIDQDFESGYETVERYFTPVEFYCPSCDLRLDGVEEMEAAEFEEEYTDQDEREIEYEPDYGND